jgi:hypothetical protein
MASASLLATNLDEEMLLAHRVDIFSSATPDAELESNPKTGIKVAEEIGGRLLLHYLLEPRVFEGRVRNRVYVTPTPYAADDTVSFLALPRSSNRRDFVILLRPEEIDWILGPRWIRGGVGIEYILPRGFGLNALVQPWEFKIA